MDQSPKLQFAHYEICLRDDGKPWELGRGAMGVTYKAVDRQLRREVALKVITATQVGEPKVQALFLREARAAARVNHGNVAHVVFLNEDPGNLFYAMEIIAGESLRDWLKPRSPLNAAMTIGLTLQMARGLEAIHREGVVHRDLKPTNLMVLRADAKRAESDPEAWQIKIIDFGLARRVADNVAETSGDAATMGFRGTALYASPEQCEERRDLDGRSDLYSLGCVMWEMLVGAPPFRASVHRELLNAHVAKPPPLHQLSHLPTSLQALVARLMLKDREARFADAGAVIRALERCREQIVHGEVGSPGSNAQFAESLGATTDLPALRQSTKSSGTRRWQILAGSAALALLFAAWLPWKRPAEPSVANQSNATVAPAPSAAKPSPAPAQAVPEKSIAVLPFESLGDDPQNKMFADAVQEDILTDLTGISDLKVIARTSVMRYRNPGERKAAEIGRELGVAYLAEGTVQRAGDKVRVNVQLIDSRTGAQVWAERYDRSMADVFAIQAEVAKSIAEKLKARLTPAEKDKIASPPTKDLVAYDYYLRAKAIDRAGYSLAAAAGSEGSQRIRLLEEALAHDPNFLAAHWMMVLAADKFGLNTKPDERATYVAKAEASLAAAKKLAPNAPETRLAQAQHYYWGTRNFGLARQELDEALALQPNNAEAWLLLADLNKKVGRSDEYLKAAERAHELSPNSVEILRRASLAAYMLRRFDRFRELNEQAAKLTGPPDNWKHRITAALAGFHATGDFTAARRVLNQILQENPGPLTEQGLLEEMFSIAKFEKNIEEMERVLQLYPTPKDWQSRREYLLMQIEIAEAGHDAMRVQELARSGIPELIAEARKAEPTKREILIGNCYSFLAEMRALAGEKEQAIADAKLASELVPYEKGYIEAVELRQRLALIYATVGEPAAAIDILEELVNLPGGTTASYGELLRDPVWLPLRKEPRFQALLARMAPKDSMRK
jgi:serine/threonine protein kinase/tetratricopeptide (TPR) repeat protein